MERLLTSALPLLIFARSIADTFFGFNKGESLGETFEERFW